MSYICKECCSVLSDFEYKKALNYDAGCATGIIGVIVFFVLLFILTWAAFVFLLVLIAILNAVKPHNICPECHGKDCLIPGYTPMAKKLIADNHLEDKVREVIAEDEEKEKNEGKLIKAIFIILAVCVGIMVLAFYLFL